jgi:hypothetical protein
MNRGDVAVPDKRHPGLAGLRGISVRDDKLFTPDFAAARLLAVIDRLTPDDSGKVFAWDGEPILP